jgi:Bacterial Ig domain
VTSVPHTPVVGNDAYVTPKDTPLSVPAPGVLSNDGDPDGDTLTVRTTPVSGPANGTVLLSSDGAFTYTPSSGFTGTDAFTYRVDDGTGRSADGIVTITVNSAVTTSLLYLWGSGSSSDIWNLRPNPPPAATPVPDYDNDLQPGLTIKASDGDEDNSDPAEWQEWEDISAASLSLNGPVTLRLWSTIELFTLGREGQAFVYLYDCAASGGSCVKIAENSVYISNWNGLIPDWVYHEVPVGSVTRSLPASRRLHVRLLFKYNNLWVAMTDAYPTALAVTTG